MTNQTSYISRLIEIDPTLEKSIYTKLIEAGKYKELTEYPETPSWVFDEIWGSLYVKNPGSILAHPNCSAHIISFALKSADKSMLSALGRNPSISDELRAEIALQGISVAPRKEGPQFNLYHESDPINFLFPPANGQDAIEFGKELKLRLFELGHPYAVIDATSDKYESDLSPQAFMWLVEREFLHRIFWSELLSLVSGFKLEVTNSFDSDQLLATHPIFENDEEDQAWALNSTTARSWLATLGTINPEQAASWILEGKSFEELMNSCESLDHLQAVSLALLSKWGNRELIGRYGAETNESGVEEIQESQMENADSVDLDYQVKVNSRWIEPLTWQHLPHPKQLQLLRMLLDASKSEYSAIQEISEHFLACMALHPKTPQDILSQLKELGNETIKEALESR